MADEYDAEAFLAALFKAHKEQSVGNVYMANPDAVQCLARLKQFFQKKNNERCQYQFIDQDLESDKLFGQKSGAIQAIGEDETIDFRAREWAEIAEICSDLITLSIYQGADGHLRLQYYIDNYWVKVGEI